MMSSIRSQSLFHQVCVRSIPWSELRSALQGRNPFFIRSVFVHLTSLDPAVLAEVAIPFSSGLCSFQPRTRGQRSGPRRNPFFIRSVFVPPRPRGLSCSGGRRNPFFIRSVFVP